MPSRSKQLNMFVSLALVVVFTTIAFAASKPRVTKEKLKSLLDQGDVIVVDDEIDTAGSISQAVKLTKEMGARDVYAVCVHPIFSEKAVDRLADLPLKAVITTDTVPVPEDKRKKLSGTLKVLSVAPLLGEVIRRAHEGRSVGEMFNE